MAAARSPAASGMAGPHAVRNAIIVELPAGASASISLAVGAAGGARSCESAASILGRLSILGGVPGGSGRIWRSRGARDRIAACPADGAPTAGPVIPDRGSR